MPPELLREEAFEACKKAVAAIVYTLYATLESTINRIGKPIINAK